MKFFEVSTDSTCDLKKDYVEKEGIWFAPLTFTVEKDGLLQEGLDNFSAKEEYEDFYRQLKEGAFSRTSMLNYQSHYEHFLKMAQAGVRETVHFTISSGLSPTVTEANKAAAAVKEKYPDFTVYAVDSLTATVGQGLLVRIAVKCKNEGWTAKQTFDYVLSLRQRIQHCIIPDSLQYLKKGGRVSSVSAAVGTVLNIKPVLTFNSQGKLSVVGKCKGMKKAFQKALEWIELAPLNELKQAVVVHTDNEKGANELARLIETKTGVRPIVEIMGPVIGSHVGPGSVSCGWISEKTREEILK